MYKLANFWQVGQPAIVAYTGVSTFWFLKALDRDYRHCLAVLSVPPYWIVVDSLANRISMAVLDAKGLGQFLVTLHRHGYRCQVTRTRSLPVRRLSLMPCTCVEIVKRALGILDPLTVTPKQLFNKIRKLNSKTKDAQPM